MKFLVVSGPSGSGKSTICDAIHALEPRLIRIPTTTTRAMRPREQDGRDYFFVTREEFAQREAAGQMLAVNHLFGASYGLDTSKLREGAMIILDIEGAREFAAKFPGTVRVFLSADLAVLEERLRRRTTMPEVELQQRLARIAQELAAGGEADIVEDTSRGAPQQHAAAIIDKLRKSGHITDTTHE